METNGREFLGEYFDTNERVVEKSRERERENGLVIVPRISWVDLGHQEGENVV